VEIKQLLKALSRKYNWIENQDMKVGEVYLNPEDVKVLRTSSDHFDQMDSGQTIQMSMLESKPGVIVGHLFGAAVRQTPEIPQGSVMLIPCGITILSLGGTCMSLQKNPADD
jgi:hypothetical protein